MGTVRVVSVVVLVGRLASSVSVPGRLALGPRDQCGLGGHNM